MRGVVAKLLRREVYGGRPTNAKSRTYKWTEFGIRANDLRRIYQAAKVGHKRGILK
jgi:hypothetical protein